MHTYIHTYIHLYAHLHTNCIEKFMETYIHTYIQTYYIYTYVYINVRTYIHTYIRSNIYTPTKPNNLTRKCFSVCEVIGTQDSIFRVAPPGTGAGSEDAREAYLGMGSPCM